MSERTETLPPEPTPVLGSEPTKSKKGRISLLIFGVVLPIITLGIELGTHMCAGVFFDPIPTWWHVLVVASVPTINFLLWRWAFLGSGMSAQSLNWLSGLALGIGTVYSIIFLPLMILGIVAIIIFGWGLLPWSPFLAFIATLRLRVRLRKAADTNFKFFRLRGLAGGMATGIAMLVLPVIPFTSTSLAMQWANSSDPTVERRSTSFLRTFGYEQAMLEACYNLPRRSIDISALLTSRDARLTQQEARNLYFRVTGRPFNSVPPPTIYTRSNRWSGMDDAFTWEFDEGLGGIAVAGRVKGLSLISSRIDGVVESNAGLGYHEWIMEFRNNSGRQREARAQLALPPGGVVSRLTLWINGEEREAAFGGRSQVREAYQKVAVQQRRDPVLVTTAGPNRVLMQCFPVPPFGGTMKVRLGITTPLLLLSEQQARLDWPQFLERNFNLAPNLKHSIWMESGAQLACSSNNLRLDQGDGDQASLQGELQQNELNNPLNHLQIIRAAQEYKQVWTPAMGGGHITQQLVNKSNNAPGRIVVVLDGSVEMKEHLTDIADAVKALEGQGELQVLLATDIADERWLDLLYGYRRDPSALHDTIARLKPVGGQDNIPALLQAWDLAAEVENGVVIWIHGPQPLLLENAEGLRQRLERNRARTRIFDFQTHNGPNRVAEKLDGLDLQEVMRADSVAKDLKELIASLFRAKDRPRLKRTHMPDIAAPEGAEEVSKHMARLWAAEEIQRLTRTHAFDEAIHLAQNYQLVTAVSGAVVLETKAQYDAAGLSPTDTPPTTMVPEPSTWIMLLLGLILLAWRWRHEARLRATRLQA